MILCLYFHMSNISIQLFNNIHHLLCKLLMLYEINKPWFANYPWHFVHNSGKNVDNTNFYCTEFLLSLFCLDF